MASSKRRAGRDQSTTNEREILRCVKAALRTALPERSLQERRRERRYPFPYPVRLEPVDDSGEPLVVLGKHITTHGLDFYYHQSIPYRRVVARFENNPAQPVELLMSLTWCRFGRHGWYENGGRFLSAVTPGGSPLASVDLSVEISPEIAGSLLGQ